ncbi:MAG: Fe-S cluster assembly sulfur transfer protein SufU [Fimbriimonadaceae bacterium]
MLNELYQEVIVDHGRKPRNFGSVVGATHSAEGFNTLCGDRVLVSLVMDGELVHDVKFEGAGCAICMASASLMTQMVKGKSVEEVDALFSTFQSAVTKEGAPVDGLDELEALVGVRQYPNRVKCATLAWHAIREAFNSPMPEVN